MAKLISKIYGDALFNLAVEEIRIDETSEELKVLSTMLREHEDFAKLLTHPRITKEEKNKIIESVFKNRLSDEIVGFLTIVINNGRLGDLDSIISYYRKRLKEFKLIGVVNVISAMELTTVQKTDIETKLLQTTKFEKLEVDYKVDQSLLGGMIIKIGDQVMDSSVRTKLMLLEKNLLNIQLTEN
jgi:F-type H+-transporting ATPase subunit delta